ncbi:MAG: TlpA family protein disulfide reductase [Chloroflexota bacterium]|nr:TlpA family protein disulfide reductase [Chloroflexota bacterium]
MAATSAAHPRVELRRLRRGYLIAAAVLPLLLLTVLGLSLAGRGNLPGAQVGRDAPAFALSDLNGSPVRLSDLRGRPVIINFWASWCGPCVREFPLLQHALKDHSADELTVVGIVFNDRSENARDFMAQMGARWPAAMDPNGEVAQRYGIIGPPESFFVDRKGIVVGHQIGELMARDLREQLVTLLGKE